MCCSFVTHRSSAAATSDGLTGGDWRQADTGTSPGGGNETANEPTTRADGSLRVGTSRYRDRCADGRIGRRRRRELLAPRLVWKPRGGTATTGMVTHVGLLSHQHLCRRRRCP